MYLNQYQIKAHEYADYEDEIYPWLALAEEAGEVLGKMAKFKRGDRDLVTDEVTKELGDLLWQLSECAGQLGVTLEDVATMNLWKLDDRKKRNVIRGSGDNR